VKCDRAKNRGGLHYTLYVGVLALAANILVSVVVDSLKTTSSRAVVAETV